LRDEVITLLFAGHDTSLQGLLWTLACVAADPVVQARLEAELDAELGARPPGLDDLARLPYVQACVAEALRLYPPSWASIRTPRRPEALGPHRLEPGDIVMVSNYHTHRHPAFWRDPDRFDPDRFMPGEDRPAHRYAYWPFGGGPSVCIGQGIARITIPLMLARIAQRHRLRLVAPPTPEPTFTLRPAAPLRAVLFDRSAGGAPCASR
jgi:cytochrome P450